MFIQCADAFMFIHLSHLSLLRISGAEAKKLLQGQLTCNLDEISEQQSRLGAQCNPQGRIISFFRLIFFEDNYFLVMPKEILATALTSLKKYASFYKVELSDASDVVQCVSYQGENLADYLSPLPNEVDSVTEVNKLLIIKLPGPHTNYLIIGEANAMKQFASNNAINSWKLLQISAGIPTLYASTSGKLLPHEINLQQINALSFNKGCYTGQEIIARMHYRGQLKKHMYRARIHTSLPPQPGDDIYSDSACGLIVESGAEDKNTYQLLVIANETDCKTKTLFIDPAQTIPLEFITLPSG
jgi:folate-binding protein YgfZ